MKTLKKYLLKNASSYWHSDIREIVELAARSEPMTMTTRMHADACKRFLRESPEALTALKELL